MLCIASRSTDGNHVYGISCPRVDEIERLSARSVLTPMQLPLCSYARYDLYATT